LTIIDAAADESIFVLAALRQYVLIEEVFGLFVPHSQRWRPLHCTWWLWYSRK
jgi:hypothetical protein